jgi:preprotein translocase subunit SecD
MNMFHKVSSLGLLKARNAMNFSLRRFLFSGLSLWLVITIVGIYFMYHLDHFINFGIDLVGGTYIRLDVQTDKAIEADLVGRCQAIISQLRKLGKEVPTFTIEKHTAILTFSNETAAAVTEELLSNSEGMIRLHSGKLKVERTGTVLRLIVPHSLVKELEHEAVQSNIAVLRTRFEHAEVPIVPHGERSIIIELPNVRDPQRAKQLVGRTALLEIKVVEDEAGSEQELTDRYGGKLPEGMVITPGKERLGGERLYYLVPAYAEITGRMLRDAFPTTGGTLGTEPVVAFRFNAEGGDKFYELTSHNLQRQIAIILDGVVLTAPKVQTAIREEGTITGSFTMQSARELATLLKSGAFVAPVTFEEERTIGPALGAESIRRGLQACALGLFLLFIFSVLIYKVAGLFAFIVLIYNLLLILFAMSWLGATLTLPGIAGMILTIGMAIDASILIYERIREELAAGSTLRKAVDVGFAGAMAVILDANITHFLVSVVLYKLGAGPFKGFAVAMIIGIISTLVTGLLLLRSIFNFCLDVLGIKRIYI